MAKATKAPIVDRELIQELTKLLDETGLTEIEIEQDGQRVRVARYAAAAPAISRPAPAAPIIIAQPAAAPADPSKHPGAVTSPMVGTAYVAPEPGAKP
ncbi:MAG TPA: acetyl-CoA carboxylase, biotin carboxyl carrier protein, partial [Pseudolabrys sp.]|nr:acetyl-CoA carboxylase, biotin carboxyl carrier protein [Pseudolabrys sp.]